MDILTLILAKRYADKHSLPPVTSSDAGKFAVVSEDGEWSAQAIPNAEDNEF